MYYCTSRTFGVEGRASTLTDTSMTMPSTLTMFIH